MKLIQANIAYTLSCVNENNNNNNPISVTKVRVIVRVRPFLPHEITTRNCADLVSCISLFGSRFSIS
jgi:hypothetical protein